MPVSEKTYLRVALEDPGQWELHGGQLRRKPGMTAEHNDVALELGYRLRHQLNRQDYRVRVSMGHVRRSSESYYIPDVFVIPSELFQQARGRPNTLETYSAPLPLVIEVWSPSTGDYDVDSKLPEYQARGDLEIWRVHPFERTLKAWRRQPNGSYSAFEYAGGVVQPASLPGIAIDLDMLFD